MDKLEVAKLLTIVSTVDNRKVAEETVLGWYELIGDIDYDVALEAVRMHQKESAEWLMPAHVRANSKRVRDARDRQHRIDESLKALPVENEITFDREEFERLTREAIEFYHGKKND